MDWKWILHPRILLLALLLMGFLFVSMVFSRFVSKSDGYGMLPNPSTQDFSIAPIGAPPKILIWLVVSVLILTVVLLVIWQFRYKPGRSLSSDPVLHEAENAVRALKRGDNIKNVILVCYLRMCQALFEDQGIERGKNVTTREFELLLQARGVPAAPVHQLTSLYESVRYGDQKTGKEDEQKGMESLNEIILSIKRGKINR